MKAIMAVSCMVLISATVLQAGIPEPDMTLIGQVSVGGKLKGARDRTSILARVHNQPDSLVGAYRLGDNPAAGDYCILRIRLESLADGSGQSSNAALIGQTVDLFIKTSDYLELYVASVVIPASGVVQYLDLHNGSTVFLDADLNQDGIVSMSDFERVAHHWLQSNCSQGNDWCEGADIGHSGVVDLADLLKVAASWLQTGNR
jgi:hypothetical protein